MSHAQDTDHGVHVPVRRDSGQMPGWHRWLIAVCLLASSGCAVSHFSTQAETGIDSAPDLSMAWRHEGPRKITRSRIDHGPLVVHHGSIDFDRLSEDCTAAPGQTQVPASLRAYYSEFYDSTNRLAMVLPVQALNGLTFGHAPMNLETHVIVCLEATAHGFSRAAMARGSVVWHGNLWASREARHEKEHEVTPRLISELAIQAWSKLWTAAAALPQGASCLEAVNAERNKIAW
ncbi:MAG TPA: hypothetical protein VIX81_09140 [Gammaproteobacteria bacterium]